MKFSYNPLRCLWQDISTDKEKSLAKHNRDMNKAKLRKMTDISSATLSKLNKGENVTTDIFLRICEALNCDLPDIVEIVRN